MRRIHLPVLLSNVESAQSRGFVILFTLESTCRALLMTVVPLQAYRLFGDAQLVSVVYLSVSFAGLAASLAVPMLMHVIKRRFMMTIGASLYVLSALLLSFGEIWAMVGALALQITATAVLEVTINLYLMDNVRRRHLNTFEPRRLLYSGMAFTVGPWLGVTLNENLAANTTYLLVALTALCLLAAFWRLRLSDNSAISAATKPPPRPLQYIPRFLAQKRLMLAWALSVGRNGWWLMFFVYTPIYATQAGYSAEIGGALVSLGVLPMILVRTWGRLGTRYGIRRLLVVSYALTGTVTLGAGLAGGWPALCLALLVLAAFTATIIDGAGNVPFLRAVRPREREEMTSVYTTYRHGTSLITPAVYAMVLSVLPLSFVFVVSGCAYWGMSMLARFLPKRL